MGNSRLVTGLFSALVLIGCTAHQPVYRPIATDAFAESLEQWSALHPDKRIEPHDRHQILAIADNLLLMQRNSGGWPANRNPFRKLSDDERLQFLKDQNAQDGSFANHTMFPQIFYLSHVYLQTGDVRYRNAARKGLRLVLAAQLYNGGWTLNARPATAIAVDQAVVDTAVTLDALRFLRKVAAGLMPYGYIPFDVRREAAEAVRKGDALLLRLQQAHNSRASIWAGAYSLETSRPVAARGQPLPTLDVAVSTDIVRYLMQIQRPPAEVIRAVEGAVDWFERNSMQRWYSRLPQVAYGGPWPHSESLPSTEPLWASHYQIDTSTPVVAGASLAAQDTGVVYGPGVGAWAETLLSEAYPAWREANIRPAGAPASL